MELYSEGDLTLEDLKRALMDDRSAKLLWEEWSEDSSDFIDFVRDQIRSFIKHIKETQSE